MGRIRFGGAGGVTRRAGLLALVAAGAGAPGFAQGTVSGRISIQEKPGGKTTDYANTVIYLAPKAGAPRVAPLKAQMAINGRNFAPRVRVVTTGSTVNYPNQDPFTHNVFSTTVGALFDLGSYGNGKTRSAEFRKAGAYPVYCNVHAKMTGYVVVVGTPWFTQAANDGRWEIPRVPAGKYTLTVWHERAPSAVTTDVDVPGAGLVSLETTLDASGYKDVAHKDKNGKDYATRGVIY